MTMKKCFCLLSAVLLLTAVRGFAQEVYEQPTRTGTLRVAVQGGAGYRLGQQEMTGEQLVDDHNKRLRTGLFYGVDGTLFLSDDFGFGLKYSDFHAKSQDDNIYIRSADGRTVRRGTYLDVLDIRFFGVMLASRYLSSSGRWSLIADYGLGYMVFSDEGKVVDPASLKGNTFGAAMDFGADLRLTNTLSLGATVGLVGGRLSSYNKTENGYTQHIVMDEDEREGLYHVSASIGLRFYL